MSGLLVADMTKLQEALLPHRVLEQEISLLLADSHQKSFLPSCPLLQSLPSVTEPAESFHKGNYLTCWIVNRGSQIVQSTMSVAGIQWRGAAQSDSKDVT